MTDSSIIQRARDVLAKWRDAAESKGQWVYADLGGMAWTVWAVGTDPHDSTVVHADSGSDAHLIVGTAGNPDLLDAIDGLLARAIDLSDISESEPLVVHAKRIAAAIIAADERMNA